jgi:hypothetical protein
MCALVESTLVADDFARVESGATPRGRLSGMAVEAAATQILGLFRSSIVSVLYMKTAMRTHKWHADGRNATRRLRTVEGMRRNDHRARLFQLYVGRILKVVIRSRNKSFVLKRSRLSGQLFMIE